ncbi:unnamed protein product [Musa hybrid cultivar]
MRRSRCWSSGSASAIRGHASRQAMRRLEAHEGKNTKGDSIPIHFATPLRKRNRVDERKAEEGEPGR